MFLALIVSAHAQTALPSVKVEWHKGVGVLTLEAPPGEHLADDAPASGWIELDGRHLELQGTSESLQDGLGLSLPGSNPRTVQGELDISLCRDDNGACRPVSMGFIGQVDGRRGDVYLAVHPAVTEVVDEVPELHEAISPERAFGLAAAQDKLVLLDFSAVWCPPCNQLMAEVLHDPRDAAALEPFVVSEIDADRADSWRVKDRYDVGGYPTVIVTLADGTEVDRIVGYPGEDAFLAFLERAQARAGGAESQTVGAEALRLVQAGQDDQAAELLAGLEEGVELDTDGRIAALLIEPTEAELVWAATHADDRVNDWIYAALQVDELSPDAAATVSATLAVATLGVSGIQAADYLYVQATLAPESAQASLYAAAARELQGALTGDAELDRAHLTFLASLYEHAGDPQRALGLLQSACGQYPHEFTYFYATAGLLHRQERYDEGLPYVLAADALAYGDQELRASKRHAELLAGMGDLQGAVVVIDAALAEVERPDEDVDVRTHRYIGQLETLRAELVGEP